MDHGGGGRPGTVSVCVAAGRGVLNERGEWGYNVPLALCSSS